MKNLPIGYIGGLYMSTSEFRYNKKRKHYAYLFKSLGKFRKNIVFSTKPIRIWKGKERTNIKLFKHPNPNSKIVIYVIPIVHVDNISCFSAKTYLWSFHQNDKRIIKRIKRQKKNRP